MLKERDIEKFISEFKDINSFGQGLVINRLINIRNNTIINNKKQCYNIKNIKIIKSLKG